MAIFWGRDKATEPTPEPASAGATWGPWADHGMRCRCTVCK